MLPLLALTLASSPAAQGVVIAYATATVAKHIDINADLYFNLCAAYRNALPAFHATAENVGQVAHRNADALVTEISEHLHQVAGDTTQQNTRVNEASADYEFNLIELRDVTEQLDEAVTVVVDSREENSGEIQHAIEAQINTQSSLALQQSMVQEMAASLAHLPELLQSNREMQTLRVENARLLLETEGYASRAEMLLDVLKEKSVEHVGLQAKVESLEAKVSGYASRMNTALALVGDKQREVDDLRNQINEQAEDKKNAGTHFSLNLFS